MQCQAYAPVCQSDAIIHIDQHGLLQQQQQVEKGFSLALLLVAFQVEMAET